MTDAVRDDTIRSLMAMRLQIDGALARLQADAAQSQPNTTAARPAEQSGCKHPQRARENISGFGGGPRKFWCTECQQTIEGDA